MVEIEISGPRGRQKMLALVDSGADRSLFNSEIATAIGLDLRKAETSSVTGVTGQQPIFLVEELEVRVEHLDPIKVPASFIDSPFVGALLGQDGFFDTYRIKFEKDHDAFEISPAPRR